MNSPDEPAPDAESLLGAVSRSDAEDAADLLLLS